MLFSYSWVDSMDDLNNYKNSELFKDVWVKQKYYKQKAEAWSTKK